jgi:hypothetical protein
MGDNGTIRVLENPVVQKHSNLRCNDIALIATAIKEESPNSVAAKALMIGLSGV